MVQAYLGGNDKSRILFPDSVGMGEEYLQNTCEHTFTHVIVDWSLAEFPTQLSRKPDILITGYQNWI